MMRAAFALALLAILCACSRTDAEVVDNSVLVATTAAVRGSVPRTLEVFGTASPSANGSMSLSVPAEGRIARVEVVPGAAVHQGQTLLLFDLSNATTRSYLQAVAALDAAVRDRARVTRLLGQHLATREQLVQAEKAAADAGAALEAIRRDGGGTPRQSLTAPFDGVVSQVLAGPGDRVAAGTPLVTLTQGAGLVVTCGVEASEIDRLHPGQTAHLEPLGDGGRVMDGRVLQVGRTLNPRSRLVDISVGASRSLLQGMAYRVRIHAGDAVGWLLPRNAVLDDHSGSYVFQLDGSVARRVSITRVAMEGDQAVVEGPVRVDRAVVVAGNYQLEDGDRVRKSEALAEQRGGRP